MLNIIKSIKLDFARSGIPETVFAKTGDRNSRVIEITPLENASAMVIPPQTSVSLAALRADGKKITCPGKITPEGKISVLLSDSVLSVPGIVSCDIVLYGKDGEICSSQPFHIKTVKSTIMPCDVTDDDCSAASSVIAKLEALYIKLKAEFEELLPDRELDENSDNAVSNKAVSVALSSKAEAIHTHDREEINGLSRVASSGDYGDLVNAPEAITVDGEMDPVSENPIMNKAVYDAILDAKEELREELASALIGGAW